jgi:hypothetical protein
MPNSWRRRPRPRASSLTIPDSSCVAQWCSAMMLSRETIGRALDSDNAVQPLSRPVLQLPRARVPGPHGVRAEEDPQPTTSPGHPRHAACTRATSSRRRAGARTGRPARRSPPAAPAGPASRRRHRRWPGQRQAFSYRRRQYAMTRITTCQSRCPRQWPPSRVNGSSRRCRSRSPRIQQRGLSIPHIPDHPGRNRHAALQSTLSNRKSRTTRQRVAPDPHQNLSGSVQQTQEADRDGYAAGRDLNVYPKPRYTISEYVQIGSHEDESITDGRSGFTCERN